MDSGRNFFDSNRMLGSVKEYGGRGFHAGVSTMGDFRKFILRGNVVDLAVGVVIGAAFNGLVQSFVKDIITPLIGEFGVKSLTDFSWEPVKNGNIFRFGDFLSLFISFLITAAVVYFFVVKPINTLEDRVSRLRPKHEEAPTTRDCPFCLSSVPLKATRCAYCTAQLPPDNTQPAQPMQQMPPQR